MTDGDEIARGQRAHREFTELEAAFAKLRAASLEKIVVTEPGDVAGRERLVVAVQTLDAIKDELLRLVGAGRAAQTRQDKTPG